MKGKTELERGSGFLQGTSIRYLRRCHADEKDPKARERLLAYVMRKEGLTIRQIAYRANRSYSTIRDWLVRARDGGLKRRYDDQKEGRPCRLGASQMRQLLLDLKTGPESRGFETSLWTSKLVREHIERRFGVSYRVSGVQKILARTGMSWKKARPRHPKSASRQAQEKFKKKRQGLPEGIQD